MQPNERVSSTNPGMGMKRITEGFFEKTEAYKRRARGGPREKIDEKSMIEHLARHLPKEEKHRKLGEEPKYGEKG